MAPAHVVPRFLIKLMVLALALGATSFASAAEPALSKQHAELIQFARARTLPTSVSATGQKQLAQMVALLSKGQKDKALSLWKQFVESDSASQVNESDYDFVQRWVARQTYLVPKKQLDGLAYKLGQQHDLAESLATHRAKLHGIAAKLQKPTVVIDILRVDSGTLTLVKKGSRSVSRDQLGSEIKQLESAQEDIKNKRDETKTKLQAADQNANQTLQKLVAIVKTMNEIRTTTTKGI